MPRAKSIATQFRAAKRKGRNYLLAAEIDGATTLPFIAFVPGRPCAKIDGDMNPRALRELSHYMEHENAKVREKERQAAARKKAGAVQKRVARAHGKASR